MGSLKEGCEGASPRSLAEPRDDSYAKVTPRRIFDRVYGIPRPSCIPDWGVGVRGGGLGVEEFLGGGMEVGAEVWVGDVY